MSKSSQKQRKRGPRGGSANKKIVEVQQCDLLGTYLKVASFIKSLHGTPTELVKETYERQKRAEKTRALEFRSAVTIQKWYRGSSTRQYMQRLNHSALFIQKTWRGFMGRSYCRIRIRNLVKIAQMNFYNGLAVKIQKTWRGYYTRKYVHNFYARKRYFAALIIKNKLVRDELISFKKQSELAESRMAQEKMLIANQAIARKKHHLVSTRQRPGIYNSPFRDFPHDMEHRLRASRPLSLKPRVFPKFNTTLEHCNAPLKPHPPKSGRSGINENIHGPFKSLREVRRQRYKPLNPSLRAATDFDALECQRIKMEKEERERRISDSSFVTYSKIEKECGIFLNTKSEYALPDFKHRFCLREDRKEKHISSKRMQTVLNPIPLFDRLGLTYTQGAVILQ